MNHDPEAELLAGQLAFYQRAAARYDEWGAPDQLVDEAMARLRSAVDLSGDVLDIACGAGQWTARLAEVARTVTALDAAPAMLAFARRRLPAAAAARVEFVCADVFGWQPRRQYGTAFMGFWLSHVPPARFPAFWGLVAACLAPGGKAAFVDTGPGEAEFEEHLDSNTGVPITRRRLADGSEHRVVKVLHDPSRLVHDLGRLGWTAHVEPLGQTVFVGHAHRA